MHAKFDYFVFFAKYKLKEKKTIVKKANERKQNQKKGKYIF